MDRTRLLSGIKNLAEITAAPLDEAAARDSLQQWAKELDLTSATDSFGNAFVRVRKGMPRRKVAFVAQLDHPAVRVERVEGNQAICRSYGQLHDSLRGAAVTFRSPTGEETKGKIESIKTESSEDGISSQQVIVKLPARGSKPAELAVGALALSAVERNGQLLKLRRTTAAGAAAVLAALHDLSAQDSAVEAWGIFTRGESLDSAGAIAMATEGRLPRELSVVSVVPAACSESVELGKGPTIRLTEGAVPLDPRVGATILGAAKELGAEKKKLSFQIDLGSEATSAASAFLAFGYQSGCVCYPVECLGNVGSRGAAHEQVDLRDLEGLVRLLVGVGVRTGAGIDDVDLLRNELIRKSAEAREKLRLPVDPATGYPVGRSF